MYKIIKNSWALFIGYGVIMVSHGFQGNLLGIRAILENFNFIATGTMMSGYFVGYFVGANMIPNLVSKVGHIRVFAAFASMASLSSLVHALFVDPIVWTLARFLTLYTTHRLILTVPIRLHPPTTNKKSGQVLSLYMFFTFFAFTIGNLLLNISSPNSYEPFILISLLFSVALIPILLTKRKPPTFKKTSSIRIKELLKISPFGSFSMFCTGFIFAAMFAMLSVYAVTMNLTVFEISILLVGTTLAGAIFQWPIGYLSDKYDRRVIVIGCCISSFIFGVLSIMSSGIYFESLVAEEMVRFNYFSSDGNMNKTNLFIFIILLSGMTLPMFALNLALVNDYIPKEKFVAAGAGLNIIFGL